MDTDEQDLLERIEGCIANAEYDDEHETLIDARDYTTALIARVERAEAENKRLREALERIAGDCDRCHGNRAYLAYDEVQDKNLWEECRLYESARAALEGGNDAE
jgi:hypothetical protein